MSFLSAPAEPQDIECPLPPGADSIGALEWNPAGNMLAAGSWDNKLRIWEVGRSGPGGQPTNGVGKAEKDVAAPVLDIAWKDDGVNLFAAGCGKVVKQWNLQAEQVLDIGSHDQPIKSVHWVKEKQFLVTGSWDKTLRYWDARTPTPQFTFPFPERVVAVDVKYPLLIAATADKKITIFHLDNPSKPYRTMASPLKFNTRTLKAFHNRQCFALSSAEGRIAIRYVDEAMDNAVEPDGKSKHAFAFKCHRDGGMIYSINSIDTHPSTEFQGVFSSAASDGTYAFWDKDKRSRTREAKVPPAGHAISATAFNATGDLFAYTKSYDWSRGAEGYDLSKEPTRVLVHWTVDKDLRPPPVVKR